MSQKATLIEKAGFGGTFAATSNSGLFNNAVVGQTVDDRRPSWLGRLFKSRKSVDPEKELLEQKEDVVGKKKLRKFSTKRNSTDMKGNRLLFK